MNEIMPKLIGALVFGWGGGIWLIIWGIKVIKNPKQVRNNAFLNYVVRIPLRNAPLTDNLIQSQGFSWVLGGIVLILIAAWDIWEQLIR